MTIDEGDLGYWDLINYLQSEDSKKYSGKWVGILDNFNSKDYTTDERKTEIVMSGTAPESVRDLMRQDYRKELSEGYNFSVVKIPASGEKLSVAVLWAGLEGTPLEWKLPA